MNKKQEVDINIKIDLANLSHGVTKVKTENPPEKIKTSLSVSQLAYLFKVLSETRVIKPKNLSVFFR